MKIFLQVASYFLVYMIGILSYKIHYVDKIENVSESVKTMHASSLDLCKKTKEGRVVSNLNAIVDTFYQLENLKLAENSRSKYLSFYKEEIFSRKENIENVLSLGGEFDNPHSVQSAITRADEFLSNLR